MAIVLDAVGGGMNVKSTTFNPTQIAELITEDPDVYNNLEDSDEFGTQLIATQEHPELGAYEWNVTIQEIIELAKGRGIDIDKLLHQIENLQVGEDVIIPETGTKYEITITKV